MCQFKRGKGNGKALVNGAVLQHYWVGEEDRRKLVSAIPDFRAVVGIPRSTYSAITTKSKMATPRMKKIVLICKLVKMRKKQFTIMHKL